MSSVAYQTSVLIHLKRFVFVTDAPYNCPVDGLSSSVSAIQAAIDDVYASGGGDVYCPVGKYLIDGQIVVKRSVILRGMALGPFENTASPATTVCAPTLLITYTGGVAILLDQAGAKITDFLFYWPNQVAVTAATPTVYPYAVKMDDGSGSQSVERCTFVNAYDAIDIQSGRSAVQDCLIGAFHNDINIDHALDWVELHNVKCQVMWNVFAGALAFGQTIDTWVMNNSVALKTARVDSLQATNFSLFCRFTGHQINDSSDGALSPRNGYGRLTNVDFDYVAYGVVGNASNAGAHGFCYDNMSIGANGSGVGTAGQAAIQTGIAGTDNPIVTWSSGHIRGSWAAGALPTIRNTGGAQDGLIYVGESVRGFRPAGALTAPAVPATTVAATNAFPYPVRVHLVAGGGAMTDVLINGSGTGAAGVTGTVILCPYDTITMVYPGTMTWAWFGL